MVYVMNPDHPVHCPLCAGQHDLVAAGNLVAKRYMDEVGFPGQPDESVRTPLIEEGLMKQWEWYLLQ